MIKNSFNFSSISNETWEKFLDFLNCCIKKKYFRYFYKFYELNQKYASYSQRSRWCNFEFFFESIAHHKQYNLQNLDNFNIVNKATRYMLVKNKSWPNTVTLLAFSCLFNIFTLLIFSGIKKVKKNTFYTIIYF